ncbi:carbohydrate kinase [Sutcliffiella cohnii]|uniref:Carbohydrate kinase n=1 Tax=Sutcliffiella cohnii TaxID=33932 RepID=A0A223KP50_9BACI|nr:PfkB family carbohydrate kinase [Sutcliffiella cohnii]AST91118.1 carbohydrate kinase [Sutcliffiella cohnii]
MKIIAIGDNVVDCYLDQGKYYPGGNCVNVLVNCKRSGAEETSYIGNFATDDKAQHLKYALTEEGVAFDRTRVVEGISGQPKVNLTEDGDRVFVGGPKNTVQHKVKIKLLAEELEYVRQFDVCHSSCYSSLEEELPLIAEQTKVSFDFSTRLEEAYLEKVCPHISFGFFSASDLSEEQLEDFITKVEKYDLEVAGFTRGSKPALFLYKGERYYQEPVETNVVDTMGAGDSFIAGFLTAFLNGEEIKDALHFAAERASETCTFYGGWGYPKEIE